MTRPARWRSVGGGLGGRNEDMVSERVNIKEWERTRRLESRRFLHLQNKRGAHCLIDTPDTRRAGFGGAKRVSGCLKAIGFCAAGNLCVFLQAVWVIAGRQ